MQAAAGLVDDPRAFLRGIHVIRVHDHTEQLAVVANLPTLLKQNPRGKLARSVPNQGEYSRCTTICLRCPFVDVKLPYFSIFRTCCWCCCCFNFTWFVS